VDLYSKKVSLSPLRVLHNLKTNVLIIKRFILPLCLLKLAKLSGVRVLVKQLSTLVKLSRIALVRILYYSNICPVAIIAAIRAAILVHVFVGSAVVALIILKVEEDIVVGSGVVASIAIIVALGLVVSVAIIVVITMRCLPRVCFLISLFSLAERVFANFAL